MTAFTEYVWTVSQTGGKKSPFSNKNGYEWTASKSRSRSLQGLTGLAVKTTDNIAMTLSLKQWSCVLWRTNEIRGFKELCTIPGLGPRPD